MKTKFIRENIVLFFVVIVISALGIIGLSKIGFQIFEYIGLEDTSNGYEILTISIFITLVLERAIEMLMNLWREPGKVVYKSKKAAIEQDIGIFTNQIEQLEEEIKASNDGILIDNNKIAIHDKQNRIEELTHQKETIQTDEDAYKVVTKQYAHISTFAIGIMISLTGFGILNHFFKYEEFQEAMDKNEEAIVLIETSIQEYNQLDSVLQDMPQTDSICYLSEDGEIIVVDNPFDDNELGIAHIDSLLNTPILQEEFVAQQSKHLQQDLFMILNLLITALLISGGTDGMHKLANVYTSFLDGLRAPKP